MQTNKRILFNNILIAFLVSTLTSCLIYIALNKSNSNTVNQTQNVNVSTGEMDANKDKVNINTASKEELKSLPNIGDKLAIEIINNRPYSSIYDLNKVNGIGEGIINNLKEKVITNE